MDLPQFPEYSFSSLGRARRLLKNGTHRLLRGCECGRGYRAISVAVGDKTYQRIYIHRGVCTLFNGPCPDGMECRHLNGDMTDNRALNLAWGTPGENNRDKILHGTVTKGEANGGAKLTADEVRLMREIRASDGTPYKQLAEMFGVSTMTAFRATVGHSWN
jgi:hypothetical protein